MHVISRSGLRRISVALALAVATSFLVSVAAPATAAAGDPSNVASYAPPGTTDVALTATATASSSETAWPPSKLIDNNPGTSSLNVWVAADTGVDAGGWVNLALKQSEKVQRVVVFPRGDRPFYGVYFPVDYTVSLLDAAGEPVWHKEVTHADNPLSVVSAPDVIDVDSPIQASEVRIDVIKRQSREGGVLQLSEVAVFADAGEQPSDQPPGTENLALSSTVTASSSYEQPGESWAAKFAIDGITAPVDGWSTDPYSKNQDPNKQATLSLRLQCPSDVDRVVIYPRDKAFPKDYDIEISSDGSNWSSVAKSRGNPGDQATPQSFDLPAGTTASDVRLKVETRNGPSGKDGYLVQIAEISVFGTSNGCVNQIKPALQLEPGATDDSWFEAIATPFTVASSNPAIAAVDATGKITALKAGDATITLTAGSQTLSVPVQVSNDIKRIGDDFTVSVFWPPTIDYVNDEQYKNLADAGIDVVVNAQIDTATPTQNLKMAALAHQYGMQIIVQDSSANPGAMSADQAATWAKRYTDIPGVGGLFMVDEPSDATHYAAAFNALRKAAPEYYAHLNFLPYTAMGTESEATAKMQDWLTATAPHGFDAPDFLMYDEYPFKTATTASQEMFTNLNIVRELGLKNDIKTATYLQAVGIPNNLRRPTAAEIRYEANIAMAYGYKQLSYFTWWTPTHRSETFTDAIMTADGQKTDLYAPVTQLNSEIHALGSTLMQLDAKQVYLSGAAYGQQTVPADYFVQVQSPGDLVISHMVDRANSDDYLDVVNNSFAQGQDMTLKIGDGVTAVREVSRADGTLGAPITLTKSLLTRHLDPSQSVLYKLVRDAGDTGSTGSTGNTGGAASTSAPTAGGHGSALANTGSSLPWELWAAPMILIGIGIALTLRRRRGGHSHR